MTIKKYSKRGGSKSFQGKRTIQGGGEPKLPKGFQLNTSSKKKKTKSRNNLKKSISFPITNTLKTATYFPSLYELQGKTEKPQMTLEELQGKGIAPNTSKLESKEKKIAFDFIGTEEGRKNFGNLQKELMGKNLSEAAMFEALLKHPQLTSEGKEIVLLRKNEFESRQEKLIKNATIKATERGMVAQASSGSDPSKVLRFNNNKTATIMRLKKEKLEALRKVFTRQSKINKIDKKIEKAVENKKLDNNINV